ncbi:MAG: hypothetical protein R2788_10515 [Saprospiraceae bacterium]
MEKTIIAPSSGQTASPQNKAKTNVPTWVKKIKSTEVGAFALGLAAYNLLFTKLLNGLPALPFKETVPDQPIDPTTPTQSEIANIVQENCQVATSVTDDMSFGEAFQASRKELGAGNFFWWRGRLYNNYQEEEWNNLSESEQTEFVQQAGSFNDEDMVMEENLADETTAMPEQKVSEEEVITYEGENSDTNSFSELNNQQQMEFLDNDLDGKDDSVLINIDDDPEAEIIESWQGDTHYALVDTGNTGMLDTIYILDDEGNAIESMPLEEGIPAPKLTREQHLDLIGGDGVIDSVAYDTRGDNHAETVLVDMNKDGSYDVAYFDTDGDGQLDTASQMVDGKFANPVPLNEPFESPIVSDLAEALAPGGQFDGNMPDHFDTPTMDIGGGHHDNATAEIEGLDNHADIDDFLH